MARSTHRLHPSSVTQQQRFVDDLSAMRIEDLWVVCDNLCEIVDNGAAVGSVKTLDALAYQLPFVFAELRSRIEGW